MALKTHGTMAVDWEEPNPFDRLRREGSAKGERSSVKSSMGSSSFRYVKCARSDGNADWHMGQDKANRFTSLP